MAGENYERVDIVRPETLQDLEVMCRNEVLKIRESSNFYFSKAAIAYLINFYPFVRILVVEKETILDET